MAGPYSNAEGYAIMAAKLGFLGIMWFAIVFVYIILAVSMPAITGLVTESANTLQAQSTMSNYPGTLAFLQAFPLVVWFIPGGVGFVATVVYMKLRPILRG